VPKKFEIVDAHQHVGSLADALSFSGRTMGQELPLEEDAAQRIRAMDTVGVDWSVLQPSHGYLKADGLRDTMRVNDRMAAYKRLAPERFRAVLGTVEPMHGEASLPEIERCKHELGLDGMAWHHRFQGCYIDSRWMWPILERMQTLDMVPLIHVNVESSLEAHWRLQRLADDFPDRSFLAMDGLWSYERARHVLHTTAQSPNVIWDLGGPAIYVSIEEWVERNGSETICFSADIGYGGGGERPKLLDLIERARIEEQDKENILGRNIRRLFGLN
jgi:predicted TIM-barrel fold metal-dependent hydrolase